MIFSLYRYRQFIWQRALADFRHRYAGTGMGIAWNVLQPLALLVTYAVIFSTLMPMRFPGVEGSFGYTLYLCSGFVPWIAFSDCLLRSSNAFLANATYLKKLPVPEHIFVAESAVSATISLAISFVLLLLISLALGAKPMATWLLLPLPLIAFVGIGYALGLLLGTLNVFFRDINQILGVTLQIVMWSVPIVYAQNHLPQSLQNLLPYHPLMPSLTVLRDLFLYETISAPAVWLAMLAWPAGIVIVAYLVLRKLRAEIRDVI